MHSEKDKLDSQRIESACAIETQWCLPSKRSLHLKSLPPLFESLDTSSFGPEKSHIAIILSLVPS